MRRNHFKSAWQKCFDEHGEEIEPITQDTLKKMMLVKAILFGWGKTSAPKISRGGDYPRMFPM